MRCGKTVYSGECHKRRYGACALHDGYLTLHTHTHLHSGSVLLIAFPLQKWLHERASTLYVHCPSCWYKVQRAQLFVQ